MMSITLLQKKISDKRNVPYDPLTKSQNKLLKSNANTSENKDPFKVYKRRIEMSVFILKRLI